MRLTGRIFCYCALLIAVLVPDYLTAAGSQTDWEKTLEAARKEGELVIYGSADFEKFFAEFHKKYPEIKVKGFFGRGAPMWPSGSWRSEEPKNISRTST